jgi:general secretion pathway protein D
MHLTPAASLVFAIALTTACTPVVRTDDSARHLARAPDPGAIPPVVRAPLVTPPEPEAKGDHYTVRVKEVPVRELLFTLAHDAELNLEMAPEVTGRVTLSAVDQPLAQILHRIATQAHLRYELTPSTLTVAPDRPFLRSYRIDYVNMGRKATGSVSVATEIGTTGTGALSSAKSGANVSSTTLEQTSSNQFWETLVANIRDLIGGGEGVLLVNRESGLITLRATQAQHDEVQELIDTALARARQQVLIEATVVEVELSDRFQSGVDWSVLDETNGIGFSQQLTAANLAAAPVTTLTIDRPDDSGLLATIKLLEQFGHLKVLSSPKVMALNNQTALLKVVDNRVYFTITVDIQAGTASSPGMTVYSSTVHTVPVGFVMAVTPQIADNDSVTINVRPTISRVLGYVRDPNPALATAKVISQIPEIQVREIESVLQVASGQIAVLGGLMQDTVDQNRSAVPLVSEIPILGDLFTYRDDQARKTELVIFLRPTVIRNASIDGDLRDYSPYLPESRKQSQ